MTVPDLNDIEARVDEFLGTKNDEALHRELAVLEPEHIARIITGLSHGKKKVFRFLSMQTQREVIWDVNNFSRRAIIASLTVKELLTLLQGMDSDDATDIVGLVPSGKRKALLANLPREDSHDIRNILKYGKDTAGQIMQTELIRVPDSFTVSDSVRRIQRLQKEVKKIDSLFVTDMKGTYLGHVPLEQLIIAPPTTKIKTLIQGAESVPVTMDQEEVVHVFKEADLSSLPVVDEQGKLVGRITSDDIVDVIEEEQSEDIYGLASVNPDASVHDPALLTARRRLGWLVLYLIAAIGTASVIGLFQDVISGMVILAAYMPMIGGMGGNSIIQIVTVMVRGIALREVERRNLWRILMKEMGVGLCNGLVLGVLIGCIAYSLNQSWMLGVVVGLAMMINVLVAAIGGTVIPLTLKLLRFDPAVASGVIATTFTDVCGFVVFLGLAKILLF